MQYDIAPPSQDSTAALVNNSSSNRALGSWGSNRRPNLALFLAGFERHAALGVNWVMFGSSGLQQRPPAGPMAGYNACVPQDNQENTHVKVRRSSGGQSQNECVAGALCVEDVCCGCRGAAVTD
jgi:hypothetical protein